MTKRTSAWGDARSPLFAAAVFGGALAISTSFLVTTAQAGEDGDGSLLGSVLSIIGVTPGNESAQTPIDYGKRPPLVLPKTMNLPRPQPRAAARDPAWPKDPDVLRAERQAALDRAPRGPLGLDTGMTKEQEMKQRAIAVTPGGPGSCGEFTGESCDPHKIWAALSIKKSDTDTDETFAPGVAPVRKYLTQPPSRYMIPTKIVRPTISPRRSLNAGDNPNEYYRHQAERQHSVD